MRRRATFSGTEESQAQRFRDCIGRFATGVTVVTAARDGDFAGMTVNSFTSVSLDPLLVLISLQKGTRTLELINDTGRFGVSVLSCTQRHVALDFAADGADFPKQHTVAEEGHVLIRGALAVVRCTVEVDLSAGDHNLIIGAVTGFDAVDGEPLLFHRGAFGALGEPIDMNRRRKDQP